MILTPRVKLKDQPPNTASSHPQMIGLGAWSILCETPETFFYHTVQVPKGWDAYPEYDHKEDAWYWVPGAYREGGEKE